MFFPECLIICRTKKAWGCILGNFPHLPQVWTGLRPLFVWARELNCSSFWNMGSSSRLQLARNSPRSKHYQVKLSWLSGKTSEVGLGMAPPTQPIVSPMQESAWPGSGSEEAVSTPAWHTDSHQNLVGPGCHTLNEQSQILSPLSGKAPPSLPQSQISSPLHSPVNWPPSWISISC